MSPAVGTLAESILACEPGEDRLRFVMDLGRGLPPFPEEARTLEHKVLGCLSNVWVKVEIRDGLVHVLGDSDAFIVKGIVALLVALYDGVTLEDARTLDPEAFLLHVGVVPLLSMGRRSGLQGAIHQIQVQLLTPSP